MIKRIVTFLMCVALIFSFASLSNASAAEEDVRVQLMALYKQFPDGKYWNSMGLGYNNPDGVTSNPCTGHGRCTWNRRCNCNNFDNAIQCMGYAYKIAYEITGTSAREFKKHYSLDPGVLRVGDVIRYKSDTHSIVVTGVKGNRIAFTDANWTGKCQIRWSEMDLSDIKGFSYVLHKEGNNRKNSVLKFYEATYQPDNTEKWKNTSDSNLHIRASYSKNSESLAKIPPKAEFYVYRHYSDGEILWGRVKYGSYKGWCALNWAKYLSVDGMPVDISFTSPQEKYSVNAAALRWNEVTGADRYYVYVYTKNKRHVKTYIANDTKCFLDIKNVGEYVAKVVAKSSLSSSWSVESKEIGFELLNKMPVLVSNITLTQNVYLYVGQSKTLKATVIPENAEDKSLLWKSSNNKIVTVSKGGKLTAKAPGNAEITVTADDGSEKSKKAKVTVRPQTVKKPKKQKTNKKNSISFSWSAAKGATHYEIYMYKNGAYKKIKTIKKTSYTVPKLKKNKYYYFKVAAVYKKGNLKISGMSSEALKAKI